MDRFIFTTYRWVADNGGAEAIVKFDESALSKERRWLTIVNANLVSATAAITKDEARSLAEALLAWAGPEPEPEPEPWVPAVGDIVNYPFVHKDYRAIVVVPDSKFRREGEIEVVFIEGTDAGRRFFARPGEVTRASLPGADGV